MNDTFVQMQQVYKEAHPLDINSGGNAYSSTKPDISKENALNEAHDRNAKAYGLTDAWLIDHHPFATTLLYGYLAQLSDALFGNWMPALVFLLIMQVIGFAVELTYCVAFARKHRAPLLLCFLLYAFFGLMPLIPSWTVVHIVKDSLFTLFFIPWFLILVQCVLDKGNVYGKKKVCVVFLLLSVALCLTRKPGVFIVGGTALFGLLSYGIAAAKMKKASTSNTESYKNSLHAAKTFLIQGVLCSVLMFVIVPFAVYPLLSIAPGSKGEILSLMLQQTARVYVDHGKEAFTSEELSAFQGVVRTEGIQWRYAWYAADPVKAQFYSDATPEELSNFVKAYFSLGARYPLSYIGAFFGLSAPVVAPVPGIGILGQGFTGWNLSFDDNRVMTWEIEETAPLVTGIDTMISALKSVPILNLLFMACLYCWWMPLVLLFFALRNRLHMGLVFVPLFIVTGFCLISPTFQWRYAFPLLLLSPVLMPLAVSIAMSTFKKRSEKAMAQLDTNTQSA